MSVVKFDAEPSKLVQLPYHIPAAPLQGFYCFVINVVAELKFYGDAS